MHQYHHNRQHKRRRMTLNLGPQPKAPTTEDSYDRAVHEDFLFTVPFTLAPGA
jgi:hypothetical protein